MNTSKSHENAMRNAQISHLLGDGRYCAVSEIGLMKSELIRKPLD